MTRRYKVFHTRHPMVFEHCHVVLVRPEEPRNVGSVARAMANMGLSTLLRIVGSPTVITDEARRLARHATPLLDSCRFYDDLDDALEQGHSNTLRIAITARIGSANRPHPLWVHEALPKIIVKWSQREITDFFLVFGPESDGLANDEVRRCDWIVGIPSDKAYRSLNLAQAVLICCYELRRATMVESPAAQTDQLGQKQRLIAHIIEIAEIAGFILPGDPFKMKSKLEQILSELPNHVKEVKTLHGLLDQVARSLRRGQPDVRGRYRKQLEQKGVVRGY